MEINSFSLPHSHSVILINFYNGYHYLDDYIIVMDDIWDLCHPGYVPLNDEEREEMTSSLMQWCEQYLHGSKGEYWCIIAFYNYIIAFIYHQYYYYLEKKSKI